MKKLIVFISLLGIGITLGACGRESDKVSYNVSQEADNFNLGNDIRLHSDYVGGFLL